MTNLIRSNRGFTLLEVIVTIVVAAVLGSLLIAFLGTAVTKSAEPIFQAKNMAAAEAIIEKISADYSSYLLGGTTWDFIGSGYTVTITARNRTDVTLSGTALNNPPNFEIKEIAATSGGQTLVSYYAQ